MRGAALVLAILVIAGCAPLAAEERGGTQPAVWTDHGGGLLSRDLPDGVRCFVVNAYGGGTISCVVLR